MFSCSLKCARATERVEPCTNCARMARRRFDAMEEDDSFELNSSVAGVSKEPDDSFDVMLKNLYPQDLPPQPIPGLDADPLL